MLLVCPFNDRINCIVDVTLYILIHGVSLESIIDLLGGATLKTHVFLKESEIA